MRASGPRPPHPQHSHAPHPKPPPLSRCSAASISHPSWSRRRLRPSRVRPSAEQPPPSRVRPVRSLHPVPSRSRLVPSRRRAPVAEPAPSLHRKKVPVACRALRPEVCDNNYRPDMTKPALARLSSVHRSLQVAKSGFKKNRQPAKL